MTRFKASKPRKANGKGRVATKPRQRSYGALKRELDRVFSIWTRRRFADANGMARCVTCGSLKPWKELQCGHFVKRHHLATRWHPLNCAPQCPSCNVFMGGNYAAYAAWGVDRYGMSWPADMVKLSKTTVKYSRADLEMMIVDYEQRIARLTGDPRE